jgi:PAS domain S-box-containing protein
MQGARNPYSYKIRRLVDSNIVGIVIGDVRGRIIEANQAFLDIVGYTREDLVSGRLRWTELTPPDWRDADEQAIEELKAVGTLQPREKEYLRKDGSRAPVLVGATTFDNSREEGVAFALDLTERKHVDEALRDAQANLAHVMRITTLGELTASIAHEVSQPLAAVTANAEACLSWLGRGTPDLSFDYGSPRWPAVGHDKPTPRSHVSVHPASKRGHCVVTLRP